MEPEAAPKVLLVSAEAETVSVVRHLLADSGERRPALLKVAGRLAAACGLMSQEAFDAVLLDLVLPCGAGIELFLKLKAAHPEAAVVVLVSLEHEAIARQAVVMGARDYLLKGMLEARILEKVVSCAIETQRLMGEVREAERLAESKREFLSTLSHELRNPLATVKAAVTYVKDGLAGPVTVEQRRFFDMACRNVDRQVRMLDNVLELERLRSGRAAVERRRVELLPLVEEVAAEFAIAGLPEGIDVEIARDLPPVSGDPDLIGQVVRNLVDNACRFAKKRVVVRAHADGGRPDANVLSEGVRHVGPAGPSRGIALTVSDDGTGIAPARLSELFGRFVQLARSSGREGHNGYKGTGLGLAICKEIVEGHGGRIWAESSLGNGSRFNVWLPAHQTAEPSPSPLPSLAPAASSHGVHI